MMDGKNTRESIKTTQSLLHEIKDNLQKPSKHDANKNLFLGLN